MISPPSDHTVHLGDFMLNWQSVQMGSIDLAIIDPPYHQTKHTWDQKVDFAALSWKLQMLLKRTGQIAIFSSSSMLSEVESDFSKYFVKRYLEVWQKPSAVALHKDRPKPDIEFISIFHRMGLKISDRTYNHEAIGQEGKPYTRKNRNRDHANITSRKRSIDKNETGLRYPSSVVQFPNRPGMSAEEKRFADHPTQKPIGLIAELIAALSNPGDRILDPFVGSGTTLVACDRLGRSGIGFEKDPNYYEMTRRRLAMERAGELGLNLALPESDTATQIGLSL